MPGDRTGTGEVLRTMSNRPHAGVIQIETMASSHRRNGCHLRHSGKKGCAASDGPPHPTSPPVVSPSAIDAETRLFWLVGVVTHAASGLVGVLSAEHDQVVGL